jgi:hypothetical protein
VCQNESLAASRAELAEDLRREVRKLIRDGKSDPEIKDYLVARYGDFVLYRPPVKPTTWLLWFGPFVLLVGALVGLIAYLRRARRPRPHRADGRRQGRRQSPPRRPRHRQPAQTQRMTAFWISTGLLTLLVLAVLCWPLLRRHGGAGASRKAINTAIYRDQLAELERDLASGALSQADYAAPATSSNAGCSKTSPPTRPPTPRR